MKTVIPLVLWICVVRSYIVDPGPKYVATKGYVWPKPLNQTSEDEFYSINPVQFEFEVVGTSCNLLNEAVRRYTDIIQNSIPQVTQHGKLDLVQYRGVLEKLTIELSNGTCDDEAYPTAFMSENYFLSVQNTSASLTSPSVWGLLRGLETFSQILYKSDDGVTTLVNKTTIQDSPRYAHRGLLVDTSRHFIPLKQLYQILDGIVYNKLNVFHWHIVDDQSFPYVSAKFPELSKLGAYNSEYLVYTPNDVKAIIEYGRQRGIRVIPEFDTPGHTRSWGVSHPELLTECNSVEAGAYGPLDPSKNTTYKFVEDLFTEIRGVFKDQYIHLGGDEVDFDCWEYDKGINEFMKEQNITGYNNLEAYYIQKIIQSVNSLNFSSIVWEEVFKNGVEVPEETIIHVWRDWSGTYWTDTMNDVTKAGKTALLSACWYLDHLATGGDWKSFYECEPSSFGGDAEQQKLLIGGEACMWAEVVNEYNVVQRIFPRASAPAEKLWSPYDPVFDADETSRRLEEHVCRMNKRGIPAQPPNAPGFCL